MFKEEFDKEKDIFTKTNLLLDLWFLWVESDYSEKISWILIPKKKPMKSKKNPKPELTIEEKESNKTISSFRIKVENAIWLAKRLGVTTQVFRNKKTKLCDNVMEIACSLSNLHILF